MSGIELDSITLFDIASKYSVNDLDQWVEERGRIDPDLEVMEASLLPSLTCLGCGR